MLSKVAWVGRKDIWDEGEREKVSTLILQRVGSVTLC